MLAPLCTTPHNSMRQMRIKTQNMIVLTLEFTNVSFFAAKEKATATSHISGRTHLP